MNFNFSTLLNVCLGLCLLALSACSETPTEAIDAPDFSFQKDQTLSAKPNCDVDPSHPTCGGDDGGSGDGSAPMYALLQSSGNSNHAANELVDPDGEGGRLGTAWAAAFDLAWDAGASEFVRHEPGAATSPDCAGIKFGLTEANMKKGKVTTVWVRGYDGTNNYSSDKISVGSQTPNDAGWTLDVQQYIDIGVGNGQNKEYVCTVYLHQIEYALVNP